MGSVRRRLQEANLVQKFALLAFVCIVAFSSVFAYGFSAYLRRYGEERELALTEQYVVRVAREHLPPAYFKDPTTIDAPRMARLIADEILFGDVFRVKVWNADCAVIWSDEDQLIGRRFSENPWLRQALAGHCTSKIERTTEPEHLFEQVHHAEVMEVYVPITDRETGEVVGVVEVYRDASPFVETTRRATVGIWGASLLGAAILFLALTRIVRDAHRHQQRLEGSLQDYSRRLEAEGRKLAAILDGLGVALNVVDREHRIRWANEIARDWFAAGERIEGRSCHEVLWGRGAACSDCPSAALFEGRSSDAAERVVTLPGRRRRCFQITASPIRDETGATTLAVELIRDVTEQRNLEAQVVHASQLAAVGELAAKVAHEINNPVGVIGSLAKVLLSRASRIGLPEEARLDLEKINGNADRIGQVTSDLLSFTRTSGDEKGPVYLAPAARACLGLMGRSLASTNVQVELAIPPDLPPILGNEGRIQQVLVNLINNAVDAMPGGGRLTISACTGSDPGRDREVWVRVTDTGCGIPPDIADSIFDPFFSTKKAGKGTGLGLPVSLDIVRGHGGRLQIESTSEGGTTFLVTLPAAP